LAIHGVSFEWEAPDPCLLYVDRRQMEQLFINLVNNAVDAMPEGGQLRLSAQHDPGAERWTVRLSDTGTGMPAEILAKVFRPMFTTKPEGKGTGLGLAISREIVRAHGGEIHIDSEEGKGTTIIFSLPGLPEPQTEA
jgi:signal transduction histidine kinase